MSLKVTLHQETRKLMYVTGVSFDVIGLITKIDFTRIELVVCTLVNGGSPIIDDFLSNLFIVLASVLYYRN